MAFKNTFISKVDNSYKPNQVSNAGSDGRFFGFVTDGELTTLSIDDDYGITKIEDDGTETTTVDKIITDSTEKITMCFNRAKDTAYIIYQNSLGSVFLIKLNLSTMVFTTIANIGSGIIPWKMIINNQGDKIIWLSSDRRLYAMGLDGSGLTSISLGSYLINGFAMTSSNKIALYATGRLEVYDDNLNGLGNISLSGPTGPTYSSIDIFSINEDCYLIDNEGVGNVLIWKVNLTTETAVSYSVSNEFPGIVFGDLYGLYSDGEYGFFYENNGTDRKFKYRFDLGSLATTRAKFVRTQAERTVYTGSQAERDRYGFEGDEAGSDANLGIKIGTRFHDPSGIIPSSLAATGA